MPSASAVRCSAATATTAVSRATLSACCAPSLTPTKADSPLSSRNSLTSRVPPAARKVMLKCAANTSRCNQSISPGCVRRPSSPSADPRAEPPRTSRARCCAQYPSRWPRRVASPRRQPCFGRRDVLGLLQACASRHEPMLRPGLERPGSAAPALGLKSLSAGSSNIFSNPRLVCTSKGMKFRGSCQIPACPSPSHELGLGRDYEQRRPTTSTPGTPGFHPLPPKTIPHRCTMSPTRTERTPMSTTSDRPDFRRTIWTIWNVTKDLTPMPEQP